jgi:2,4-diaminopentanoate dehydrogenase
MARRVIQWASGNVGAKAVQAVLERPDLELAGIYVRTPAKDGRDVGDICGLGRTLGVKATSDVEAILAMDADCVLHMPLPSLIWGEDPQADTDTIVRLLESGKNVITTVGYLYPKAYGADVLARLEAAGRAGRASLHGTGLNPGFIGDLLPLVLSAMSRRIERVHVTEISNFAYYPAPDIMLGMMRMGQTREQFEASAGRLKHWLGGLFRESVMMVADGLGAPLDDIVETYELALAEETFTVAAGTIEAGRVAGQHWKWVGLRGGRERVVHETIWRMGHEVAPHWPQGPNSVVIEGEPAMRLELGETWLTDPLGATAWHAVNAIEAVCAAEPGVRSFLDLPLLLGRGTVSR